jgi:hypothetical protein
MTGLRDLGDNACLAIFGFQFSGMTDSGGVGSTIRHI